jgi:hypothetical protein
MRDSGEGQERGGGHRDVVAPPVCAGCGRPMASASRGTRATPRRFCRPSCRTLADRLVHGEGPDLFRDGENEA